MAMGSPKPLPWCGAQRCPATQDQTCHGYIDAHLLNETAQNFVACCEIQCGRSANDGLVGLRCGGATTAMAISTCVYLLFLLAAGGYMVTFGPFRRMKTITSWIIVTGSVIFTTGTGVFVTNVSSPFMALPTVPAVGAMNVAIFSYFFSGFHYGVGVGQESAPLFAFMTTAWTIGKELHGLKPQNGTISTDNGLKPEGGSIRTDNGLAIAMLVFSFTWIVHSISYRLYGYRVDWNRGYSRVLEPWEQDHRLHMGAAQGHPTWRTPMGQSTSVIMTALSWSLVRVVKKDLRDNRACRPDWVFQTMLYGAPILISITILWNIMSRMRCREITGLRIIEPVTNSPLSPPVPVKLEDSLSLLRNRPKSSSRYCCSVPGGGLIRALYYKSTRTTSYYPGVQSYGDFIEAILNRVECRNQIIEYANAAALQRMQRNTMFVERVPYIRLRLSDKVIGFLAWLLALVGLLISFPGFCSVWLVSELLGMIVEVLVIHFGWCKNWLSWLVSTNVTDEDRLSAAKVVEECLVEDELSVGKLGDGLSEGEPKYWGPTFSLLQDTKKHRSINLNPFLDASCQVELASLLIQPGMRRPN